MALFDAIFGGGTDTSNLTQGSKQARQDINAGKHDALQTYGKYEKKYTPVYQQSAAGFDPFLQQGTAANAMYGNALGLNGQSGYDAAIGAFHNGPGFQFALDQANQNVLRNAAATGGVANGNVLTALSDRAQGLQNQEWQQYLDNLFRGGSQGLAGAVGKSGALEALASQLAATGAGKAGVQVGAAGANATNAYNTGLGLQNQTAADQASQLSLLNAILGAGAKVAGAYAG